jgi:hypothetical protein
MAKNPNSEPFAKGRYMQVVKAGESAQEILRTEEVTGADRKELMRTISMAESAKKQLRKMGVDWV